MRLLLVPIEIGRTLERFVGDGAGALLLVPEHVEAQLPRVTPCADRAQGKLPRRLVGQLLLGIQQDDQNEGRPVRAGRRHHTLQGGEGSRGDPRRTVMPMTSGLARAGRGLPKTLKLDSWWD